MKKIIGSFLLLLIISFAIGTNAFAQKNNQKFTPEQIDDIHKIVREYLIKNPEVLIEVSNALRKKQEMTLQAAAMKAIANNKKQLFEDPESPVIGNKDGKVILVEFFDYQCGHCKEMKDVVLKAVKSNPELKLVFKEFPIFGENSVLAAKAALAAAKQSKYFALHDALLSATDPISEEKIYDTAKQIGLNVDKLKVDMNDPVLNKQIQDSRKLAETLQLMGTPAFVLANKEYTKFDFIPGTISPEDLQAKINSLK